MMPLGDQSTNNQGTPFQTRLITPSDPHQDTWSMPHCRHQSFLSRSVCGLSACIRTRRQCMLYALADLGNLSGSCMPGQRSDGRRTKHAHLAAHLVALPGRVSSNPTASSMMLPWRCRGKQIRGHLMTMQPSPSPAHASQDMANNPTSVTK